MKTSPDVDNWFEATIHPLKDLMLALRHVMLAADGRVDESVKWKTPTFSYKGNIASINPQAKQFLSVMFHQGAKIPGDYPSMNGSGDVARYIRITDAEDLATKREELERAVRAWCDMKDA